MQKCVCLIYKNNKMVYSVLHVDGARFIKRKGRLSGIVKFNVL